MAPSILSSAKLAERLLEHSSVLRVGVNELRLNGLEGFEWQAGQPLHGVAGRGAIHQLHTSLGPAVIRHYRRGGSMAALLGDRYWFSGAATTRCFLEFAVLQRLVELGLPVCRPLAARFVRTGLCWYRADLCTLLIPGASSLHQLLCERGLRPEIAQAVGVLIARFHAVGLWHADLNAHNVLCDQRGEWWLIDLDRSNFQAPAAAWRQANLQRLERSWRKLGHLPSPSDQIQFMQTFTDAYVQKLAEPGGSEP